MATLSARVVCWLLEKWFANEDWEFLLSGSNVTNMSLQLLLPNNRILRRGG